MKYATPIIVMRAVCPNKTMDRGPQSRDRLSFFMDLTLRRAKGFVQNKLCRKLVTTPVTQILSPDSNKA
jgi:hypothetical protein